MNFYNQKSKFNLQNIFLITISIFLIFIISPINKIFANDEKINESTQKEIIKPSNEKNSIIPNSLKNELKTNSEQTMKIFDIINDIKEEKISVKEEYRKKDYDIFKEKVLIPADQRRSNFVKIGIINWILDDSTTLEEIKKDICNRLIGEQSIFVPLDMSRNAAAQNFFTYPPKK